MDFTEHKQLLINLKQMIDVSQSRGCWKACELKDIGITYNSLCKLLEEIELNSINKNKSVYIDKS